jgi:hypothetical protein
VPQRAGKPGIARFCFPGEVIDTVKFATRKPDWQVLVATITLFPLKYLKL